MKRLSGAYDAWWESLKPTFGQCVRVGLGSDAENPARLMSHDWLVEDQKDSAWHQVHVTRNLPASGPWAVQIVKDGRYRFDLYRWPKHLNKPAQCSRARIKIGHVEARKDLQLTDACARFELDLKAGPAMLQSWMTTGQGREFGAYFVWVERLKD